MKLKYLIIVFLLVLLSVQAGYCQINPPIKKRFNVGAFTGLGGVNLSPIPAIDVAYRGTILRVAPGYKVFSAGLCQEIKRISPVFYNGYWVVSAYYSMGSHESTAHIGKENFTSIIALTGVRFYFGSRFYSSFQGGAMISTYKASGYSDTKNTIPYFEFSIGLNLFRNYLAKTVEQ